MVGVDLDKEWLSPGAVGFKPHCWEPWSFPFYSHSITDGIVPRQTTLSRWYLFTIVTLATFAVGLIGWRVPSRGFHAETLIVQRVRPTNKESITAGSVSSKIREIWQTDLEQFRNTYLQTLVDNHVNNVKLSHLIQSPTQPFDLNAVQIGTQRSDDHTGSFVVKLEYAGRTDGNVLSVTEMLTQHYIDFVSAQRCAAIITTSQHNHTHLVSAHNRVQKAQQHLYEFLSEYFVLKSTDTADDSGRNQHNDGTDDVGSNRNRFKIPATSEISHDPKIRNLEWQTLDIQIMDLQKRLETLLVKRTDTHPTVRKLMNQMDELQKKTQNIPKFSGGINGPHLSKKNRMLKGLATSSTDILLSNHSAGNRPDIQISDSLTQLSNEVVIQFDNLYEKWKQTHREYDTLLQAQRNSNNDSIHLTLANLPQFRVTPPQLVHFGCGWSYWRISCIAVVSILTTAVTITWLGHSQEEAMVNDAEKAQQIMSMPILGEITSTTLKSLPRMHARKERSRFRNLLMHGSESVLVLFVLAFMFSVYTDSQLTRPFWNNPYGTLTRALIRHDIENS